jgi:hypothetical protein
MDCGPFGLNGGTQMAISASGRLGGRALTEELRRLAGEAYTVNDGGDTLTRRDVLAEMIWKQALGWTEEVRDEDGNLKRVVHPPVAWCQQYLFERMEGKAPVAAPDEGSSIKAADKVRDLARDRLNRLAVVKSGPPKPRPTVG